MRTRRIRTWILGFAPVLTVSAQEPPKPAPAQGKPRTKDIIGLPENYIRFSRVGGGGIQPLVFPGADGTLRVLYFVARGDERGDLFTCVSKDEGKTFSEPRRLNATEGSVAAPRSFHRAAGALAAEGLLHVLWLDSSGSADDEGRACRLAYTRVGAGGDVEPERDLFPAHDEVALTALAVDPEQQNVFAFFAAPETLAEGATRTRIWGARSTDAGASFSEPVTIDPEGDGVCVDSAISAGVSPKGALYALYRMFASYGKPENPAAGVMDSRLLTSVDDGQSFKAGFVDNWKFGRDPQSGACLFRGPHHMFMAFEGRGQVYWSYIKDDSHKIGLPIAPKRKWEELWRTRAVVAANDGKEVILVYLERPRAGTNLPRPAEDAVPVVAWQVWDKSRNFPIEHGVAPDAPGKSSPAVFVRADGGFTIVY